MGRIIEEEKKKTCSTLNEALLLATMCLIGSPVDVYIIDGSIFSGIFHTGSLDNGYGIVLKKAKMIRKGTQNANATIGELIETLVVFPGDLVQLVAQGVTLPADHDSSGASCDDEETISGSIGVSQGSVNGDVCIDDQRDQERQVGVALPQEEEDGYCINLKALKEAPKVNGSKTSLNDSYSKLNVHKENHEVMAVNHLTNGWSSSGAPSIDAKHVNQLHDKESTCTESVTSENSNSSKTELDAFRNPLAAPVEMVPQNSLSNKAVKESKLNPSAKVFSPSFPNFRSTPPLVQTAPSVAYVSNSIPAVQVAGAQPEVGVQPIVHRQSWPVKFVPYVTSTSMSADNGLQYGQPQIAGHTHVITRAQPMRNGAQYQPIQAMPPYVHPNPQNSIYGRPGQLVYVHPVTHDVIQNPATLSQGPHPVHVGIAKNEGLFAGQALPVSVTPPLIASGLQPYTMPSHIHLSQPLFSSMHPIPILGPNIPYNAKFP